jgi:hypothetical protein
MSALCAWIVAATVSAFPSPAGTPVPGVQDGGQPASQAQDQAQDPYDALEAELEAASKAWNERYSAAATDEERQKLLEEYPERVFVSRFAALAEQHPKTSVARRALTFVVMRGDEPQQLAALATLERDFLQEPELAEVCPYVRSMDPKAQAFLQRALAESPHRAVKGQACYALAQLSLQKAERATDNGADPKEHARRAEELLVEVEKSYADVELWGSTLGKAAAGDLFELRELAIGKVAPDIQGQDIDGVAFKLSDYRGKVVVLDFWGNW